MKKLSCATQIANQAYKVDVESAYVRALPGFSIVGLASQSIQESKDRIKSALLSVGFSFPAQKITINLSPSDMKKEGSHFDLPIAILIALQKEECQMGEFFAFGELGLDGAIKPTNQIFPLILSLTSEEKIIKVLVPKSECEKIASIPNVEVYGVEHLSQALDLFKNEEFKQNCLHVNTHPIFEKALKIDGKKYVLPNEFDLDFKDVLGQSRAKRAALISAAGMHNILLEGSPGCGKSMIIKRLRYILPPMSLSEVLETSAIKSLSEDESSFSPLRPFRSPHHTSSRPSIFGGGSANAKAGEVSLAHLGVLFFDEFPHFTKQVLESLREPLEDKCVLISRVNTKVRYPTKFLFASAQNPCPCGFLLSEYHSCKCTDLEVKNYKSKLSAPLMDRIDIFVQMDESRSDENEYNSKSMQEVVLNAFKLQKKREQIEANANLSDEDTHRFCPLDFTCKGILDKAISRYGLSQRSINKILRLARTIADIGLCEDIKKPHLLEALSFRKV